MIDTKTATSERNYSGENNSQGKRLSRDNSVRDMKVRSVLIKQVQDLRTADLSVVFSVYWTTKQKDRKIKKKPKSYI